MIPSSRVLSVLRQMTASMAYVHLAARKRSVCRTNQSLRTPHNNKNVRAHGGLYRIRSWDMGHHTDIHIS